MRNRWGEVRKSELIMLVILVIIVFAGDTTVIWQWYDLGMDHLHAQTLKYSHFEHLLRGDPAFEKV